MLKFIRVANNIDEATDLDLAEYFKPKVVDREFLKPFLLYLEELRGKNESDIKIGTKDEIDDIRLLSDLYANLTHSRAANKTFFDNGILLEPKPPYSGITLVVLTSGEFYYIGEGHDEAIEKAKNKLGSSLEDKGNDSLISSVRNSVNAARKNVVIDKLILNLEKALGIQDTLGEFRAEYRVADSDLKFYDSASLRELYEKKLQERMGEKPKLR